MHETDPAPPGHTPAPGSTPDRGLGEMNIRTTYDGESHIEGRRSRWLVRLHLAAPTGLCGAYLPVGVAVEPAELRTCERCEQLARPRSLSEWVAEWREHRRALRATEDAWESAETFTDLCDLTARWLEGEQDGQPGLIEHPGGYDVPDPETIALVPALAALNRGGFLTFGSQPGLIEPGYDGAEWQQRAAVDGFVADPAVLSALTQAAMDAGLWFVIQAPAAGPKTRPFSFSTSTVDIMLSDGPSAGPDEDGQIVVTTRNGYPCTDFGGRLPARYIRFTYGQWCSRTATAAVTTAQQFTIVDPIYGRDNLLWLTLTQALTDLVARIDAPTADDTTPPRRTAPREDTGR